MQWEWAGSLCLRLLSRSEQFVLLTFWWHGIWEDRKIFLVEVAAAIRSLVSAVAVTQEPAGGCGWKRPLSRIMKCFVFGLLRTDRMTFWPDKAALSEHSNIIRVFQIHSLVAMNKLQTNLLFFSHILRSLAAVAPSIQSQIYFVICLKVEEVNCCHQQAGKGRKRCSFMHQQSRNKASGTCSWHQSLWLFPGIPRVVYVYSRYRLVLCLLNAVPYPSCSDIFSSLDPHTVSGARHWITLWWGGLSAASWLWIFHPRAL